MIISVKSNMDRILKDLKSKSLELPVIIRKAVNDGVREAEKAMVKAMDVEFDRPTPFSKRATLTRFANKDRGATGEVIIKERQAAYLAIHTVGGVDLPKRKVHAVGVSVKRDQYGNPSRTQRKNIYAKANTKDKSKRGAKYFIATGKLRKDKHLAPGLYKRGKDKPQLMFFHIRRRAYHKRWSPERTFSDVAINVFEASIQRRLKEAGLI